jgi:hypothetical protein
MMAADFDKVIFLISTDFFATELFGEFDLPEIEKMKAAARSAVSEMIRGAENYYIYADFSPARQQKTQHDFYAQLQAQKVDMGLQKKIYLFDEILCNPNPERNAAANVITSVAACLYWLY